MNEALRRLLIGAYLQRKDAKHVLIRVVGFLLDEVQFQFAAGSEYEVLSGKPMYVHISYILYYYAPLRPKHTEGRNLQKLVV